MKKSRTIILQYGPASSVWHLPSGTSQLTALLKTNDHHVIQRYGHIIGLEYVLARYGGATAEEAISTIKKPNQNIESIYSSRITLEKISKNIQTDDRFSVQRNNIIYVSNYYDGSINGIMQAVRHKNTNIWYEYFNNIEIPIVNSIKPDIYGISIADERQLIPGIILASMIKDSLPNCLVVLGGNFWTRTTKAFLLPESSNLLDYCDLIIYSEGYQPLLELANTLNKSIIPGAVWKDKDNQIQINKKSLMPTDFSTLPTPIFPETRQWSPDLVLPLYTASNCFEKCSFCSISAGSDTYLKTPRWMKPHQIAQHMVTLSANRFDIFDEILPIVKQIELGKELVKINHGATWQCYLTATSALTRPEVCENLYKAGCRAVQLGLESLSLNTLIQENKKWNKPQQYGTILKNLKNSGIHTHIFIIVGIPGEPLQQALNWIKFLEDYGEYILTVKIARYRLAKLSPEELTGNNQLIEIKLDVKPLRLNREFLYKTEGLSHKKVDAVLKTLEAECHKHWAYEVTSTIPWWVNRGRYSWNELKNMASKLNKLIYQIKP